MKVLSGVISIVGGLSIALGWRARWGAWLISMLGAALLIAQVGSGPLSLKE